MILKVLFLLGFLIQGDAARNLVEPVPETVGRDSIKTEMVLRSEDLVWKSPWNFISLDRMSYKVNTGSYGFYGPQPTYLLDGIPVDPTFFGMNYSQLLPVSFNQIRKLQAVQGIGVSEGVGYHAGLLRIDSVPVRDGISVDVSGQFGHNTDEPGPWIFDREQVTPNIERFGPWADAGVSFKAGSWYAKGLVRTHTYLHVNQFVQTRIKNILGSPPEGIWPEVDATTHLGLVETGIRSESVDVRLQAIRSESEEFLYFQPFARELPTNFTTAQYSALGSFSFSQSLGIRTMFQYREKETGYRNNRLKEGFEWHQTHYIGRASAYLDTRLLKFDIGSEFRETETTASGFSGKNKSFIDLFLNQQIDITSFIRFGSYSAVTFHEDVKPIRTKAFLEFDILPRWTTSFEGSYSELLPETANPIDQSIIQGYDILNRLGVRAFLPNEIPVSRLYTFSHQHRVDISDGVHAGVDMQFVNHLNFQVPYQDVRYNLFFSTMPGAYFLLTDNKGQRINISFDTGIQWADSFYQKTGLYWAKTVDGDTAYKSYWKTIPEYLIRHTFIFTPYPDLELRLNMQYQTESVWDEFRRLDGKLNRTFHVHFPYNLFRYSHTIPGGFDLDFVLSKWFWEQRIRAVFMLSNLFNQEYQTHPIGTQEGFGYMLRLELRL